ncbi:hypothetical protein GCM10023347_44920 [Streptomyces chumphonensis]
MMRAERVPPAVSRASTDRGDAASVRAPATRGCRASSSSNPPGLSASSGVPGFAAIGIECVTGTADNGGKASCTIALK